MPDERNYELKHDVLGYDDIVKVAPFLRGHQKIVGALMRFFAIDKCNALHGNNYLKGDGHAVTSGILSDLNITLDIENARELDALPQGPFITVSNHPFGALDGIALINIMTARRPEYKVMVNMILNQISGMRSNFIAVDALASDDPKKKAVSMRGIKEAIMQVRSGKPLGFFPAGAVSKINGRMQLVDREWQPNVIRIIKQCGVPVIPVFFHGSNSWWFNLLGRISWQLRTLRLPAEVFGKHDSTIRVTIGNTISVENQKRHSGSIEGLGRWLKSQTYALRSGLHNRDD